MKTHFCKCLNCNLSWSEGLQDEEYPTLMRCPYCGAYCSSNFSDTGFLEPMVGKPKTDIEELREIAKDCKEFKTQCPKCETQMEEKGLSFEQVVDFNNHISHRKIYQCPTCKNIEIR